jgi:hypothetical protein
MANQPETFLSMLDRFYAEKHGIADISFPQNPSKTGFYVICAYTGALIAGPFAFKTQARQAMTSLASK